MAAFDIKQFQSLLGSMKGLGDGGKDQTKAQKELKKLEGKLQSQLAEQQAQYSRELEAQRAASQLAAQREAQAAEIAAQRELFQLKKPLEEAQIYGNGPNGQPTLAARELQHQMTLQQQQFGLQQQEFGEQSRQFNTEFGEGQRQFNTQFGENARQFNTEFGENQRQFNTEFGENQRQFNTNIELERQGLALEQEIERGQLELARITQQQQNAIAQGQLDLSREMETRKIALEEQQLQLQNQLQTAELSGFMPSGQLTEAARAQRAREVMEGTQLMGVDSQGRLTDASQQWRTQAGLEAARTRAQLGMQSEDYFEAAAYGRDPNVQNTMAFLNNPGAQGSSMGFRAAATGVPGTATMQSIQGGPPQNPALQQAFQAQQAKLQGALPNPQTNVPGVQVKGPSASVSAAMGAQMGAPAAFTTTMHKAQAGMPVSEDFRAAPVPGQPTVQGSMARYNANATGQPLDEAQLRLAQIQKQLIQPGAHKLAPGTMEAWSPTEKGLVTSALKASGVNPADFEQQYKRAKLQTGTSALAM